MSCRIGRPPRGEDPGSDMWSDGNYCLCAAAAEMVIQCNGCVVHWGKDGGDSLGRELSFGDEGEHPRDERAGVGASDDERGVASEHGCGRDARQGV